MKLKFSAKLLTVVGGTLVLALAAGGIAYASTNRAASRPAAHGVALAARRAASAAHPERALVRQELHALVSRTVHAELIVKTKTGYKTVDVDRGVLTSTSGDVLTLTRPDGPTVSTTLTGTTKFLGLGESKLATGDKIVFVQSSGDALVVAAKAA